MRFFTTVLAAATAGVATAAGAAAPVATSVFDRTLVCATAEQAGVRLVSVFSAPTTVEGSIAALGVGTGNGGLAGAETERGAFFDRKLCKPTRTRVRLSARGLPGPAIAYNATAICPTGRRVLVRLRYTYVPGHHDRHYQVGGRLISASLLVLTPKRRPLAFAALTADGATSRLLSAGTCETRS